MEERVWPDREMPPSVAIAVSVISLFVSIAFWMEYVSIFSITARESANHIVTTIRSWKESIHSEGSNRDLLITCSDENMYELRYMLYEERADEINSALSIGAEASICTSFHSKRIMEISVNGHTLIPFGIGYNALIKDSIGYACIGAFLDMAGIMLLVYGIRNLRKDGKYHFFRPGRPGRYRLNRRT